MTFFRIFFEALFRVLMISWVIFFLMELRFTGFVSNFFNAHWLLLFAILSFLIFLFLKHRSGNALDRDQGSEIIGNSRH